MLPDKFRLLPKQAMKGKLHGKLEIDCALWIQLIWFSPPSYQVSSQSSVIIVLTMLWRFKSWRKTKHFQVLWKILVQIILVPIQFTNWYCLMTTIKLTNSSLRKIVPWAFNNYLLIEFSAVDSFFWQIYVEFSIVQGLRKIFKV